MNKKREQLFPLWLPALIALGVTGALVVNYPREGTPMRILSSHAPSELSIAYLQAWLRVEPNSPQYLGSLADQYLKMGRWNAAMQAAQKLASLDDEDGGTRQWAVLLELGAMERLAYEKPVGDAARVALMEEIKEKLADTERFEWDVAGMQALAEQARRTGDRALMLRYYKRLALGDTANPQRWHAALAQAALAQQQYETAATAYFAAYEGAAGLDLKRRYFIAALNVLVSSNQVLRACDEATQRLGPLAGDPETLRYLIGLARQVNRVDLVVRYARALVDGGAPVPQQNGGAAPTQTPQRPVSHQGARHGDARALPLANYRPRGEVPRRTAYLLARNQPHFVHAPMRVALDVAGRYELAFNALVESNQLDDAQKVSQRALDEGLDVVVWARRLAEVAQWNNRPEVALGAWLLLARASDDMEAWGNVLRLAPELDESEAYLAAWERTAADQPGTGPGFEQSRRDLFAAYMKIGHWDAALEVAEQLGEVDDDAVRQQALLLRVQASEQAAYQFAEDDPRRVAAMNRYIETLNEVVEYEWDAPTMAWVAQKAREAGDQALMVDFYQRLVLADPTQEAKWRGMLGDAAAERQAYEEAVQAYFAAQQVASTREEKRTYFLAALKTLVAADQVDRACTEGERHVGELAHDPETLRYLLDIARQANRTALVSRYARALIEAPVVKSGSGYVVDGVRPRLEMQGMLPKRIVYRDGLAGVRALGNQPRAHIRLIATESAPAPNASAQRSQDYELAFNAFVGSGQLEEAEALAEKALAENMDIRVWGPRLAQTAEWNSHPQKASNAWLKYAQASGDQDAWDRVLKLSSQLNDNLAYLLALRNKASRAPSDLQVQDELVRAYEKLGQPEVAMSYLQARARGALRQPMLERYAAVAARSGNDPAALEAYSALLAEYPANSLYAMHIASLEYRRGNLTRALAALRQVGGKADDGPETAPYWSLYGELARLTGNKSEAEIAYKHLLATGRADAVDLDAMTYFYEGYPIDAGRIAEMSYRKEGSTSALAAAISFYTQARAWPRIQSLLGELTAEQREVFEQSVNLLSARAEYYLRTGQWQAALDDLQLAASLPEASDQARIAYLWALVDFGTEDALRMVTHELRAPANANSAYWGVFAAAQMRLNNPAEALKYLRLQYEQSAQDPLWLLTLADAEAAAGREDVAWTYRREAYAMLEKKAVARQAGGEILASADPRTRFERQAARISLSQVFANGDVSRDLLVHLLRQAGRSPGNVAIANSILADTVGLPPVEQVMGAPAIGEGLADAPSGVLRGRENVLDDTTKSVVLAWALSGEHNDLARAWLAREYAEHALRPIDSTASLALAAKDRAELGRLLEVREGAGIPLGTRVQALMLTGQGPAAETLVFEAAQGAPDSNAVNDLLVETLAPDRPSIGVDTLWSDSKPFEYLQTTVVAGLKLTGRFGLNFEAMQRNQRSTDEEEIPSVPSLDRTVSVALHDTTRDRDLAIKVGYRDGMAEFFPVSVSALFNRQGPLSADFLVGVNQLTDLSPRLHVGAVQDVVRVGVNWNPESRWFMGGAVQASRIYSQSSTFQDRVRIGRGVRLEGNLGYRIRSDFPDWSVRLTFARGIYNATDRMVPSLAPLLPEGTVPLASEFMSENFTQYGFMVGLGNAEKDAYSRAWRPFMDAGMVHDSNNGWGPQLLFGLGGPVAGRDRLQFHVLYENASPGTSERALQVGLSYRMMY